MTIQTFDSPEEYAAFVRGMSKNWYPPGQIDWRGGTMDYAINALEHGDTSNFSAVQKIMDKIELADLFTDSIPVLEPTVAGFVPNVPAAIAGHPESMFRRGFIESPSILAPINIYVEISVSAGVTHTQLLQRGIAILAFVLAMERVRPIELYAVSLMSDRTGTRIAHGSIVKIASKPMDIGRAVWMLTAPAYLRQLGFATSHCLAQNNDCDGWAISGDGPTHHSYETKMRQYMQMQPDDVFMKGGYLFDNMKGGYLFDNLMLTDPVAWVTKMIAEHSGKQNEA